MCKTVEKKNLIEKEVWEGYLLIFVAKNSTDFLSMLIYYRSIDSIVTVLIGDFNMGRLQYTRSKNWLTQTVLIFASLLVHLAHSRRHRTPVIIRRKTMN